MCTARSWITFIRYPQNGKIGEPNNLKVLWINKTKVPQQDCLNRIAKIGHGHLFLREENLSFEYYIYMYSSTPFIKSPLLQWRSVLIRGVDFLEVDNLVVFYYLSASEIWPDKSRWPLVGVALLEGDYCERGLIRVGGLWWEWPLIGVAFGGTLGVALLVGEYCNSITNRKLWHLVKSDVTGYILTRG